MTFHTRVADAQTPFQGVLTKAGVLATCVAAALLLQGFSAAPAYADENEKTPEAAIVATNDADLQTQSVEATTQESATKSLDEAVASQEDSDEPSLDPLLSPSYITIDDGIYTVASESGSVMEVADGSTANHANIQTGEDASVANQRFQFTAAGVDNDGNTFYTITDVNSEKVLSVAGYAKADGSNIDTAVGKGYTSQQWYLAASTTASGETCYVLVGAASGKALDVNAEGDVRLGTASGSSSQNWILTQTPEMTYTTVEEGVYTFESEDSAVMEVADAGVANHTNIQTGEDEEATNQRFQVTAAGADKNGNALYTITDVNSSKVLSVAGYAKTNGSNVDIAVDKGYTSQQWYVATITNASGEIRYVLVGAASGKALDVDGKGSVRLWTPCGIASQNWNLAQAPVLTFTTVEEGIYVFETEEGTVMEVADGSSANHANVQTNENESASSQRFQVTAAGTDKNGNAFYTITAPDSGKVLSVNGYTKTNGSNVDIMASKGYASQQWYVAATTNDAGETRYVLVGAASGKALDVDGSGNVRLWTPCGIASQNWNLNKVPALNYTTIEDGLYIIESEYGTLLDIANSSSENFANVQSNTENGSGTQRFRITAAGTDKNGNTFYTITGNEADKVLDCYSGGTADGTNIAIYTSNGTAAQQWYVATSTTASGEACFVLVNVKSGKVLDLAGEKAGSNVRIWSNTGSAAQNWILNLAPVLTYTTIEEGAYVIQSESGKSLDITGSGTANFTNAQVYTNSETVAQRFNISNVGTDQDGNTLYTITNVNSGKVLDCYSGGTKDDTNIAIYVSNDTDAQKWYVSESTTESGKTCYIFINAKSGKALDVDGTSNKSNVRIWTQNGGSSQNWILKARTQTITEGAYVIASAKAISYAIDIKNDGVNNGDKAEMAKKDKTISQAFALAFDQYSGYYTIVNYGSGKVLEAANGSSSAGTLIQQNNVNGKASQLWRVEENVDGTYTIVSAVNNYVVDVVDGTVKKGAKLQLYTSNGTAAQKFNLISTVPTLTATSVNIANGSNSNLVVDIKGASTATGAHVQLYTKNNTFSQTFVLEQSEDGTYSIRPVVSGLYLTSGAAGSGATQQYLDELYSQKWVIAPTTNGHFTITTVDTNKKLGTAQIKSAVPVFATKCELDYNTWNLISVPLLSEGIYTISPGGNTDLNVAVSSNSLYAGANISVAADSDSNAQKFIFKHEGGDTYTIYGAWSTMAFDVAGGDAATGANIQQYYGNGTDAQKWSVTWNDGAFLFKSLLGDYALSVSSFRAGANIRLADYNEKASKQRFLLMQTSMTTPSTDEIIEVLDVYAKGDDLTVIKSMNTLSQKTLDDLWGAISDFWAIGTSCGFTIVDLVTGAGLTYNSDTTFYSACSIKGPYSMALAQYEPSALWAYEGSFWAALDYSNNETYQSYFYKYGQWPLERYKELGHVENFTWTNWTAYYTAEDLCRMWVVASDYLLGDTAEAEWLRDVLSNNSADLMRASAEWWDAETTYAKSGWIDFARTEGSLVIASGDHLYAVGMMSSTNENHDTLLYHLAYYLCQAMDELVY